MPRDRLYAVLATTGVEPAPWGQTYGDPSLIEPNSSDEQRRQPFHSAYDDTVGGSVTLRPIGPLINRRQQISNSASSWALEELPALGRTLKTTSRPRGRAGTRGIMMWRSRRATRCRTTAFPTARLMTRPTRGHSPWRSGSMNACSTKIRPGAEALKPRRKTRRKSAPLRRRAAGGSTYAVTRRERSALSAQLATALVATSGDDRTARAGTHPEPPAVLLGPTTVVRLKSALALTHESLLLR